MALIHCRVCSVLDQICGIVGQLTLDCEHCSFLHDDISLSASRVCMQTT